MTTMMLERVADAEDLQEKAGWRDCATEENGVCTAAEVRIEVREPTRPLWDLR